MNPDGYRGLQAERSQRRDDPWNLIRLEPAKGGLWQSKSTSFVGVLFFVGYRK